MAVTNADILGWLNANPNATPELINQTMAEAGVSAAQYQDATGTPPPTAAPTTITELYQQVLGRAPESAAVIADWENQFGSTIDPNEIAQFEKVAQLEKTNPEAANLKGQILGQNLTSQWTGQGYGSAEANAEAIAKLLADAGITDIKQFGKLESGGFGNKETGQEINRGSGRWENQGGENLFSGTGEGKGNTAFRADFAPDGTPIFYTTQGSSSDVADIMPLIQIGLMATGAGGLLGNALLGAGASQVAAGALGNAILGGVTSSLAGGDALKGALLGGAGGALGGYLQGANAVTLGDASDIAMTMADSGSTLAEIESALASRGFGADVITDSLKDAANAMSPTATNVPIDGSSLVDTVKVVAPSGASTISTNALTNILSQVPNIITTGTKAPEQVSPDVVSAANTLLSVGNAETPTVKVTDQNPNKADNSATVPIITPPITTNLPTVTTPTVPTTTTTGGTTTDTKLTTSDVIKLLGIGTTIAGINAATGGGTGGTTGGTQYPIVDVPSDWRTPPKPSVAPATALPPINFGDRNLLIGTQWEKFLDPNYGQVPEPVQYSQPSNLSYNDLMGILGSKQGMPPASSLSINDIISGIQNQYGQANRSSMG